MNMTISSSKLITAALAVVFALVILPTSALAIDFDDTSIPVLETPGLTLPGLTTSSLKIEPVTCQISVDKTDVAVGGSVIVSWDTNGADTVTINGEAVSSNGQMTIDNILVNTTFELFAKNEKNGSCKKTIKVHCLVPEVPKNCELQLVKSVDKTNARPGEEITYTIDIKNIGTADCTGGGVRILDELDPNITYISHSLTSNLSAGYGSTPVYDSHSRTLWFNGHELTPQEEGRITWVGKIATPSVCGNFEVKNQAKTTVKELDNFNKWFYSNIVSTHVNNSCVPEPSCDFFTATPQSIRLGESLTLEWGTTNVTEVFINNGVGNVAVDGSVEVSPLENTTYVLTAVGTKKTVDCHVKVEVDTTPERPECPFVAGPNITVYNFNEKLRSDDSLGNSQTNVIPTTLLAGTYNIRLASWDAYSNRDLVSQPREQWQLEFLTVNSQVGISNAISDLPDNVKAAYLEEQVNTRYVLTEAVDGVRAVHAAYVDLSSPNSVDPICASVEKVEDPAPTCDSFTANPSTIFIGSTSTLTWETSNASRVTLNNGFGEVAVDGSVEVNPLASTIYQLTVFGTNNRSVQCEVPVTVSEDPVPICVAFTATPNNLPIGGGAVTLSWEVEDATTVTISPTIGSVALIGSTSVNVTESTTYTLTAVDVNGDEVSCVAPVSVPDPVPFTCANNVTFGASPNSVRSGSDVTLTWNATDVDSVSINVINATTLSGSQVVNPTNDTTYILTATLGNQTIECPTTVTVSTGGGGGGSSSPRCELDISKERISLGEEITLTWDSSRASDVTITDDLGNVVVSTKNKLASQKDDFLDGSITLSPTRDTRYTMVAERGSRDRTCRVAVDVEDDIVILETRDQQPLVAGISLSAVPYTGFEAGPFVTIMFYALLIAWAFYIAYILVIRKHMATPSAKLDVTPKSVVSMQNAEAIRPDVFVKTVAVSTQTTATAAPVNLPMADVQIGYDAHQVSETTVADIEDRAHEQKALLSSDAIRHFIATTSGSVERNEALDGVIAEAKKVYPLEDGWIVINESRMKNLCEVCQVNAEKAPATFTPSVVPQGSSSLAEAIVTGNIVAAYEMIGNRPMFALADAAADLDAVYRNRRGESKAVSAMLASETKRLSDEQLKKMISALTSALDGTYTSEAEAVKMAIMKAVKESA